MSCINEACSRSWNDLRREIPIKLFFRIRGTASRAATSESVSAGAGWAESA